MRRSGRPITFAHGYTSSFIPLLPTKEAARLIPLSNRGCPVIAQPVGHATISGQLAVMPRLWSKLNWTESQIRFSPSRLTGGHGVYRVKGVSRAISGRIERSIDSRLMSRRTTPAGLAEVEKQRGLGRALLEIAILETVSVLIYALLNAVTRGAVTKQAGLIRGASGRTVVKRGSGVVKATKRILPVHCAVTVNAICRSRPLIVEQTCTFLLAPTLLRK